MTDRLVDAFCVQCNDVSPHDVLDADPSAATCTVCETQQQVMLA